jgi:hypothetical protein
MAADEGGSVPEGMIYPVDARSSRNRGGSATSNRRMRTETEVTMDRTGGNPTVLRAQHRHARGRVAAARGPVEAYDRAIRAVAQAPASPEVALVIPSIAPVLDRILERIGVQDDQLVAYADALEWADATVAGFDTFDDQIRAGLLMALVRAILDGDGDLATIGLEVAADAIGHHAARHLAALIADPDADFADWQALQTTLAQIATDERASVAFLTTLGVDDLAAVPTAIEAAWLGAIHRGGDLHGQSAWDVLGTISAVFATASWTLSKPDGLPATYVDDLLALPFTPGDHLAPTLGAIGLLFTAGGFSDGALLPLADLAEAELARFARLGHVGGGVGPWGIHAAPANTILPALGESPAAAAQGPRVAAQLLAMGAIDEGLVGHTMIQVALQSQRDGYTEALEAELVRLGLQEEQIDLWREGMGHVIDELNLIETGLATTMALHREALDAERTMRLSPDARARQRAHDLVDSSPSRLHRTATSPVVGTAVRWLPAIGAGTTMIGHLRDGTPWFESSVRTGASFAGGAGGAKLGGWLAAPLLFAGPAGWVGYGTVVLGFGGAGAWGGDRVAASMFDVDPDRHLWADTVDGRLPPSPVEAPLDTPLGSPSATGGP